LHKRSWNNFKSVGYSTVRPTFDPLHRLGLFLQTNRDSHLCCPTAWGQEGVEHDVAGDGHRVGKISVDFVQDILRWTSEKDGACFGGCTFCEEGEISDATVNLETSKRSQDLLIAEFINME
jgi:hypothetical protein